MNLNEDKLLVVCPILDERTTDICLNSIVDYPNSFGIDQSKILLVDNSKVGFGSKYESMRFRVYRDPNGHNLGCSRAWNLGVREVIENNLDYLVVLSASMMFGHVLNGTFLTQLQTHWGENFIEAVGHSWHLIAFHRTVFEKIGLFDENFYPAYFEDCDFGRRIHLSKFDGKWNKVWINALSQGNALHIRAKMVSCPPAPLLKYYEEKWGGGKGNEKFDKPFGGCDMGYFPKLTITEIAKKYKLDNWW
jgi:hypothetical protein